MGEIDQAQYPIYHGVAQGDEGIDRPELKAVDRLLDNVA
jgi:hypothetical protein